MCARITKYFVIVNALIWVGSCIFGCGSSSEHVAQPATESSSNTGEKPITSLNPKVAVDLVMPPLRPGFDSEAAKPQAAPSQQSILSQQRFSQFYSNNQRLTFDDLTEAKPVANRQAFSEMKEYFSNLYDNVSPSKTITIGSQTFECIPIRQQPSLRNGNPIDIPPESDDPPQGHSILGYQNIGLCPR